MTPVKRSTSPILTYEPSPPFGGLYSVFCVGPLKIWGSPKGSSFLRILNERLKGTGLNFENRFSGKEVLLRPLSWWANLRTLRKSDAGKLSFKDPEIYCQILTKICGLFDAFTRKSTAPLFSLPLKNPLKTAHMSPELWKICDFSQKHLR